MLLFQVAVFALLWKAFVPQIEVGLAICFLVGIYIVFTLLYGSKRLKFFPLFHPALAVLSIYSIYTLAEDSFDLSWFYTLFAALIVAFRLDTRSRWESNMSTRKKLMISSWQSGAEGSIYGYLQVDAANLLKFIEAYREKHGVRVTVTHTVLKALGLVMKAFPSVNGRLILGRFYPSETADISCLVHMDTDRGHDLGITKVTDADTKKLTEVAHALSGDVKTIRSGKDDAFNKRKSTLSWFPTVLLEPMVAFSGFLSHIGMSIPAMGVKPRQFGSALLTSVGMLGLDMAFVPFTPFAHVPVLLVLGQVAPKAVVNPKTRELEVKDMIPMSFTVDHRFLDGAEGGQMITMLQDILEHPEKHLD